MKSRVLSRAVALAAAGLVLSTSVAWADNVQNDVVVGGNDTIYAGGSTAVSYRIAANNGDGQTGCNAADASPATVTINAPSGVTAAPGSLAFTACGSFQGVVFSSGIAGNYSITVSVSDAGTGTYNTNPATFTLHVLAPPDSTPPVITKSITGTIGANSWYTSDVNIDWTVADPESSFTVTGCVDQTLTAETTGTALGCSATSAGGTSSDSATVKLDKTGPTAALAVTAGTVGPNDWYMSDVTVSTTGADPTSEPVTCTADQYQLADTVGTEFAGSCTNDAGLTTDAALLTIKLDKTGPSATLAVTAGTPGDNGWYTSAVTVSTTGSDPTSEPVLCTGDQYQATDTSGTEFHGSCTNDAGQATDAAPLTVKLDSIAPTINFLARTPANGFGWNNGDVEVTWSCSDAGSGVVSGTVSETVSTEGVSQSASGTCKDLAGNVSAAATASGINIDKTPPTASASRTPEPNANGWNNTDITVSFSGADDVSGIDSCSADQVFDEGADQSASGTCMDKAGNVSAPATVSDISVDKTAPTASASRSPAANGFGWNNVDVTVSFTGDDGLGSGIDFCDTPVVLSTEGAGQSASGTCADKAGNVSPSAWATGMNIDKTSPSVGLIGGPADGGAYFFGFVPAAPTCSASDILSGLDGICSVSGYGTTVGGHTVTASANDQAGNTATASAQYSVLTWTLGGFYRPVDMDGILNVVKNGSTVPLKFEVFAGPTELTSTSVVQSFTQAKVACENLVGSDEIEITSTGGTSLRYDTTGGQFIQNWQTPKMAGHCYRVTMTTQDGSFLTANFKLK